MKRMLPGLYLAAFAVFFLALAVPIFAATAPVAITYTRATTYVDGTALPASAITAHGIKCVLTPTGGAATPCTFTPLTFAGSAVSGTTTVTYPPEGGRACFALTTRTATQESDPSNETCRDLPPLKPSPPTNVTVTITVAVNVSVNGKPVFASTEKVERESP